MVLKDSVEELARWAGERPATYSLLEAWSLAYDDEAWIVRDLGWNVLLIRERTFVTISQRVLLHQATPAWC